MTTLEVIEREKECVLRQGTASCNRDCSSCDLVLPSSTVINAYDDVIFILKEREGMINALLAHGNPVRKPDCSDEVWRDGN